MIRFLLILDDANAFDRRWFSLRKFSLLAAVIVGLAAGFLVAFPVLLVAVNFFYLFTPHILPEHPSAGVVYLFALGLYAIWFFVFWKIQREMVGQLNYITLFFFALPLPSIMWTFYLTVSLVR